MLRKMIDRGVENISVHLYHVLPDLVDADTIGGCRNVKTRWF